MAQPATSLPNPVSVIGPQFCVSGPVELVIARKTDGNFAVTDINGNIIFKQKEASFSMHDGGVLLDSNGNPIVTLREKMMTAHCTWKVFKGESKDSKDLLFSAKQSSMVQLKTKLNVFLANNTNENSYDFQVKGSWSDRSCVVYAGDSSTIIAQMEKKKSVEGGKGKLTLTVYPNIDYAFIVSLIFIFYKIIHDDDDDDVVIESSADLVDLFTAWMSS